MPGESGDAVMILVSVTHIWWSRVCCLYTVCNSLPLYIEIPKCIHSHQWTHVAWQNTPSHPKLWFSSYLLQKLEYLQTAPNIGPHQCGHPGCVCTHLQHVIMTAIIEQMQVPLQVKPIGTYADTGYPTESDMNHTGTGYPSDTYYYYADAARIFHHA